MALQNNLIKQVDLPTWEQLTFAPAVSSALSAVASADNSFYNPNLSRYLFFLLTTNSFWKYDTWENSYIQLASPPIAPLTWSSLKVNGAYGFEGRVLAGGASTFTAPAYYREALLGSEVRIISGTGRGQQRVITDVADPVIADSGVATAATTSTITDSTKTWTINQWQGFQVRITYGAGVSHVRRILYNDATSITYNDVNQLAVNYNANPQAPVPAFGAVAGSQSVYAIESSVFTVDTTWDTAPDATSKFRVHSGAVTLVSSAAATPFYTHQIYDVASDTWYIKTATQGLLPSAGTDGCIERTTENGSVWARGVATGGTTTTLIDANQDWEVNELAGRYVRIYSGTGRNQIALITSNTANTLNFAALSTAPDTTSRYNVEGFTGGTATAGGASTLTDSGKTWTINQWANYLVRIVAGTGIGQTLPILSNTGTVLTTYKPWTTAPDSTSQYLIQGDKDNSYLFAAGFQGVIVHSFEADMAINSRGHDDGLARIGSAQYGEFPAVAITTGAGAAGTITITTAIPHGFRTGWSITHRGDTGASAVQNNITATITVTGATTYTYPAPGSTAAWTLTAHSTTVLKDATKNWTVNEHANKVVYFTTGVPNAASGSTPMVAMEILSNTANTLTLKTATTAPLNGTSRYAIATRAAIGALDSGIATGTHSTTTLQDTSKTWVVNQWAGRRLKMVSGAGQSVEIVIASNTANTLTFAVTTAPISASTSYSILGGAIRGLGINPCWTFGTSDPTLAGRFIVIPRGGAVSGFDRLNLNTDQWEMLTTSPISETLTTGSMYAYDGKDRFYFTKEITLRIYCLDLIKNTIEGAGNMPYLAGTAILGNRMEVFQTADKLKYLWVNRHSFQDCFRRILFDY
jgi:hypothetical protein